MLRDSAIHFIECLLHPFDKFPRIFQDDGGFFLIHRCIDVVVHGFPAFLCMGERSSICRCTLSLPAQARTGARGPCALSGEDSGQQEAPAMHRSLRNMNGLPHRCSTRLRRYSAAARVSDARARSRSGNRDPLFCYIPHKRGCLGERFGLHHLDR